MATRSPSRAGMARLLRVDKAIRWKVVLMGASFVGKSSLMERMIRSRFTGNLESTIGMCFFSKEVIRDKDDRRVMLMMYDTAGAERYASLTKMYYRDADLVLLVYAVDDPTSLERAELEAQQMRSELIKSHALVLLVGNKQDIVKPHAVSETEARALASKHDMQHWCVSAKMDYAIRELFQHVIDLAHEPTSDQLPRQTRVKLELDSDQSANSSNGHWRWSRWLGDRVSVRCSIL